MSEMAAAFLRLSAASEAATLTVRVCADQLLEVAAERGDTVYTGPCVCDVCPCPLQIVHGSGTKHCWPCERGDHWA